MIQHIKHYLPFLFFIGYLILFFFIRDKIPNPEAILGWLEQFYRQYGYPVVFISAILEGTMVISFYVPGSTAILVGAALSQTGALEFPLVIALATIGLVIGQTINYLLGRFGVYHVLSGMGLEKGVAVAEQKLKHHRIKTLFLGYFHPGSASLLSTAAGVVKIPFLEFLLISFLAQLLWSMIWGTLAYLVGVPLVEFFLKYFTVVVLLGIGIWLGIRYAKRGNE